MTILCSVFCLVRLLLIEPPGRLVGMSLGKLLVLALALSVSLSLFLFFVAKTMDPSFNLGALKESG